MNALRGTDYYLWISEARQENLEARAAYVAYRRILEKACRELTQHEPAFFPNLFSRLNYICRNKSIGSSLTFRINSFRIRANHVLHEDLTPGEAELQQDLRALCDFICEVFLTPVPKELDDSLPRVKILEAPQPKTRMDSIRGEVVGKEGDFLFVSDANQPQSEAWKVRMKVKHVNDAFDASFSLVWIGCQVNLLDITFSAEGELIPRLLVLEPDYLVDITSIAETYKEYGSHPLNFFMDRLKSMSNNVHKLKGTIANAMFDKCISAEAGEDLTFSQLMKEAFRQSAFDLTTCADLDDKKMENQFFTELELQHRYIRNSVEQWFRGGSNGLDKEKGIVEPSFLCEKLGLQGRMDFIHRDFDALVELKSGKANEYSKPFSTKSNHYIQLLLYLAVMKYSLEKETDQVQAYIFYSRYPLLMQETADASVLRRAINLRNCVLGYDYRTLTESDFARKMMRQIQADVLNIHHITGKFWENILAPQIYSFQNPFSGASPLELDYFYAFYVFVVREQYLGKLQVHRLDEDREGSYWTDFASKKESGDILYDLNFASEGNKAHVTEGQPSVLFQIPKRDQSMLPNFRIGDIVLFYERNKAADNATNKQVFKGTVSQIDDQSILIVLKFRQRHEAVLPASSRYAVEHDFMDSSGLTMFRALYSFLKANPERKKLILYGGEKRQPAHSEIMEGEPNLDISGIVEKAKSAGEVFLLSGPPGTGKTSKALHALVEEYYHSSPSCQILLLSYTNRAVDEICEALEKIEGQPEYIRIGNLLSCDESFHHRLLERKLQDTRSRKEVRALLVNCRIMVGTIASINHKLDLFNLKTFDLAIIDEASQILEPSLLGILCAKNKQGGNAVGKVIMIGDSKQLPAVVLQDGSASVVDQESLLDIGLQDRRDSLFERWGRLLAGTKAVATLHRQGRMHEQIADFPNRTFYKGRLRPVPTPLQLQDLPYKKLDKQNPLQAILQKQRLLFIPSGKQPLPGYRGAQAAKTQMAEARIVAKLVLELESLCQRNQLQLVTSEKSQEGCLSIGIITPYRRQIALIRAELRQQGLALAETMTIDTVERYQGSQRDIILYSLCLNTSEQLDHITSIAMDEEDVIDRKLNVALTRAKQQMIITGNSFIMGQNLIFRRWLDYMEDLSAVYDLEGITEASNKL
jgi:hypothetical protein